MATPKATSFVNGFYNIAYITGLVTDIDKVNKTATLEQINISGMGIIIHYGSLKAPNVQSLVTVTAHVYGKTKQIITTSEDGTETTENVPTSEIRAIYIERAQTLTIPPLASWGRQIKNKQKENASIYDTNGKLIPDHNTDMSTDEGMKIVLAMMEATSGRLDSKIKQNNSNMVAIAGVVNYAAIIPGKQFEDGKTQDSYIFILIRQHENEQACIPARISPNNKEIPLSIYMRAIKIGYPIRVVGQARTKIILEADGKTIKDKIGYIRISKVFAADKEQDYSFASGIFPSWWLALTQKIMADQLARKNAVEAAKTERNAQQRAITNTDDELLDF